MVVQELFLETTLLPLKLLLLNYSLDDVKSAKRSRRKAERKLRRTRLHSDFQQYKAKKNQATFRMNSARRDFYRDFIHETSNDQKKLFRAAKMLFNQRTHLTFPNYQDPTALANDIGHYFVQKFERIRSDLDTTTCPQSVNASHTIPTVCFDSFYMLSEDNVKHLISKSSKKSSSLDPMTTPLVLECLDALLPVITRSLNLSLESGSFPNNWRHADDVHPGLNKSSGEDSVFSNLLPINNLSFVSKLTGRDVCNQTHNHLSVYILYPKAQSSNPEFHSTETALLRVKHEILMNMNQQHVTLLVLLDLSAAFDAVDHDVLLNRGQSSFYISGRVWSCFQCYLDNCSQSISVNVATSTGFDLQHPVPQWSCLGPLLFVMYASKLFSV